MTDLSLSMRRDHLLPASASSIMRAAAAASARIDDIAVPVRDVRDPTKCPEPILPWLAQHHSVDEWNPAWSVEVKRNVIASSYDVKRRKGTRAGVMLALRAQGFGDVRYDTWFEYGGSAYRFKLTVSVAGDQPWSADDHARLLRTTFAMKAQRSRLEELRVARPMPPTSIGVAGLPIIRAVMKLRATGGPLTFPPAKTAVRGGLVIHQQIKLEAA